jgi:hypothetical protein
MKEQISFRVARPRAYVLAGIMPLMLLSCATAGWVLTLAQEIKIIPQDRGLPPIIQSYDPAKDEFGITVSLRREKGYLEQMTTPRPGPGQPTRAGLELSTIQYHYPGKSRLRPLQVNFMFTSGVNKSKYQTNRTFSVSADGIVVHEGEMEAKQQTYRDNNNPVVEGLLTVIVPTDAFLRLAQAKKIQFKIGPDDYKLDDTQRKQVRALADMIEPLGKRP